MGLAGLHADRADRGLVEIAGAAQQRQQPARLGPVVRPDRQREPRARPERRPLARGRGRIRRAQILGRRHARAVQPQVRGGDLFRAEFRQQLGGETGLGLGRGLGPDRIGQQARAVLILDILGRGRCRPVGGDPRGLQQPLGLLRGLDRHDQRRDPLAPGTPRAPRAVQQPVGIGRQFGMHHQIEIGQVDATRRHVRGDADLRPPVAHRLQGMRAFGLAELARQRHHGKAAIGQPCCEPRDHRAGIGKDDGVLGIVVAQQVDHRALGIVGCHAQRLIGDIGVLLGPGQGGHPLRVALERSRPAWRSSAARWPRTSACAGLRGRRPA